MVKQLSTMLQKKGTSEIRITGVEKLHGCYHEVIPDRIETGTYLIIGALVGENLKVFNVIPEHVEALTSKLQEMGVNITIGSDSIVVSSKESYKPVNIKTMVYPGFATDLQQPFSVLAARCNGKMKVEETIWENRFMHLPELEKLGMKVERTGMVATFTGPNKLKGAEVKATDLRAGAALVAAALAAEGETTITDVEHILRGYEGIVEKLTDVGATIKIEEI